MDKMLVVDSLYIHLVMTGAHQPKTGGSGYIFEKSDFQYFKPELMVNCLVAICSETNIKELKDYF